MTTNAVRPRAISWYRWLWNSGEFSPKLATLVPEPFHRHGRVYEEKVDGWRIIAHKDGSRVWLVGRTGRDHAGRFLIGGIVDIRGDFGGVMAGEHVAGKLVYRGIVEWGFTGWSLTDLLVKSKALVRETSPFVDKTGRRGSCGWSQRSRPRSATLR